MLITKLLSESQLKHNAVNCHMTYSCVKYKKITIRMYARINTLSKIMIAILKRTNRIIYNVNRMTTSYELRTEDFRDTQNYRI
jgi:hypothetical protein